MKKQNYNREKEIEFLFSLFKMSAEERKLTGWQTISEYSGDLSLKEMRGEYNNVPKNNRKSSIRA